VRHLAIAAILARLETLDALMELAIEGGPTAESPDEFIECLVSLKSHCDLHGLEFSEMAISPILDVIKNRGVQSYTVYQDELKTIRGRILDELRLPRFFFIPREKAKFFELRDGTGNVIPAFGPEVHKRFGKVAGRDIDEAGKCYAAGRNTACVFHVMRVIEVGLEHFQKRLNVKTKSPNWDIVIGALQKGGRCPSR
jgi:hypothetical protein